MRIYRCDVCGTIYDTEGIRTLTICTKYGNEEIWKIKDLCPECAKSLKKWYETQKEQNNGRL